MPSACNAQSSHDMHAPVASAALDALDALAQYANAIAPHSACDAHASPIATMAAHVDVYDDDVYAATTTARVFHRHDARRRLTS